MTDVPILSPRALNRATLERQMRAPLPGYTLFSCPVT